MVKLILILVFFIYPFQINSNELNKEEEIIFNFIDFNQDTKISFDELNQSLLLILSIPFIYLLKMLILTMIY